MTGTGVAKAIVGADAVVHAATTVRQSLGGRNDIKATRLLLGAAREAHVKHFVYVSIVGIDRIAYPYYRSKVVCEALVADAGVPWSILRATQFHELMETYLSRYARVPRLLTAPLRWQFQPVEADEVAARLVEVALGQPGEVLPDFGGPEIRDFESIGRAWLKARHEERKIVNLELPFRYSRQFADGLLLCPDHRDGKITFEQYLADRYPPA